MQELQIGDDLFIRVVPITELREQDVNAQQMQPRHFERLTENIRARGQIESLPYCHRPHDEGPTHIISGHHRVKAARAAGLKEIPVIVDTREMTRSAVVARQIAHNELHGDADQQVLAQLIREINNVDDLLTTGLDEDKLPTVEDLDTKLLLPHVDLDWRILTLTFLPKQLEEFDSLISAIDNQTDLMGVAERELFERFSKALVQHGRDWDIKSMGTILLNVVKLAEERHRIEADPDRVHIDQALGIASVSAEQAEILSQALVGSPDPAATLVEWATTEQHKG